MTLQRSTLYPVAAGSGAKFEACDGWDLPKAYTDDASEYAALTTAAAVYDNSHLGRLKATGEDALDLINRLSTNNVLDLAPGQGAPTILTTDRGRILDLIGVVNVSDYVLLLTSTGGPATGNRLAGPLHHHGRPHSRGRYLPRHLALSAGTRKRRRVGSSCGCRIG